MKIELDVPDENITFLNEIFGDAIMYVIQKRLKVAENVYSNKEYDRMIAYYDNKISSYETMRDSLKVLNDE